MYSRWYLQHNEIPGLWEPEAAFSIVRAYDGPSQQNGCHGGMLAQRKMSAAYYKIWLSPSTGLAQEDNNAASEATLWVKNWSRNTGSALGMWPRKKLTKFIYLFILHFGPPISFSSASPPIENTNFDQPLKTHWWLLTSCPYGALHDLHINWNQSKLF